MSVPFYDLTVPVLTRGLRNLDTILDQGRAFADKQGLDHASLLDARLAPDMLPLTGQVQRTSDTAKFLAVRVGGVANVPMEDNEASFDALKERIQRTIDFLAAVPREAFDGKADATVTMKVGGAEHSFTGISYVLGFALPNFYFHITTAYDVLRHKGVPLGKRVYLGA